MKRHVVPWSAPAVHEALTPYKINQHKRPPTFINREFWENLFKTHAFSENFPFSICFLFGSFYAISTCHSLGKIKTQKNPAIKDWIAENKKMVDHFRLIRKILPSSNGCKLMNYGHRFVKLRKYLCFCYFMQQRKIFCSTERTFAPKQTQYAPKNSCTSDFCFG